MAIYPRLSFLWPFLNTYPRSALSYSKSRNSFCKLSPDQRLSYSSSICELSRDHRLSLSNPANSGKLSPDQRLPHSNSTNSLIPQAGHPDMIVRRATFQDLNIDAYPFICRDSKYAEIHKVLEDYGKTFENGTRGTQEITVRGRISSVRKASSKLAFYDICHQASKIQIVCSAKSYIPKTPSFFEITRLLHRGDYVEITGLPGRTKTGQLSIFANSAISLLAPCLHAIPASLKDPEKRFSNRHVDFLVNPQSMNSIRIRSLVLNYIRHYLLQKGFVEVETPVLAESSGGANALPFETSSRAVGDDVPLHLRISPELWLKRLVIGGFDKVFEIGKSFRNEGIDATHNPEFTTCEFYQSFAGLDELMDMTEELLIGINNTVNESGILKSQVEIKGSFNRLNFIPALEEAMNRPLPDLTSPTIVEELVSLFQDLHIPLPRLSTAPRLLDKLSSKYLEPQCQDPTFIYNIPALLSPLAKSSPTNTIARRFELYIHAQELCNAYEEENNPLLQRHKFQMQQHDRETHVDLETQTVDESFITALEWGLPPTAGWGLGIDRLCMLITAQLRINEVLPFGGLKQSIRQADRIPSRSLK
ncbi:Lysine--tRNA ligase, mitochondrial [Neolecta irregularis DAH-3]|uniref:Lysine--tRNA ligase n=1 Tax=Neolecta irregularis (strain DAH-3) TaxID=1198029 RepID=A0A1U7LKS3_NEOID|nr:Lysine--tRNA ligase, mitochondrial [Neolecta irregularis DAH-3]|eukprot:OLL23121.1 Lysine--tRNA ligase, mitochondrial [Neolecta irregularis DAH-3]